MDEIIKVINGKIQSNIKEVQISAFNTLKQLNIQYNSKLIIYFS